MKVRTILYSSLEFL